MSILFCTPAYGGNVTVGYLNSCLSLQDELLSAGVDCSWLTITNESLITRARNTCVSTFLETDFEALMFIDADIEFAPEAVNRLWNMDKSICCGAYPMKRPDMPLSAWKGGKTVEYGGEPYPVDYAGTGFMMIHRGVFEEFRENYPECAYDGGFAYFDTSINGTYLSEDYTFCERARKFAEIYLDPEIRLKHWGTHIYGA